MTTCRGEGCGRRWQPRAGDAVFVTSRGALCEKCFAKRSGVRMVKAVDTTATKRKPSRLPRCPACSHKYAEDMQGKVTLCPACHTIGEAS
jgi:hypothetical protein